MNKQKLSNFNDTKKKEKIKPIFESEINGKFFIAVYQGSLSENDILIKYRQINKGKWSRLRTPKHIHWAVDVLIKMHFDREKTRQFLDLLSKTWGETKPIKDKKTRDEILNIDNLLGMNKDEINKYEDLGKIGEYSIKFLFVLAKLLMFQEKTNNEQAYMFKDLIEALKSGEDIFKIVSIATHRGK